jgi:hypothetical protein
LNAEIKEEAYLGPPKRAECLAGGKDRLLVIIIFTLVGENASWTAASTARVE